MTRLLIARHGNTFAPGETPVRVGKRNDLPLVDSGKAQARNLGLWLKQNNIQLAAVYSGNLLRSYDTADIALQTAGFTLPINKTKIFDEVDYGIDEGKTETQIIRRIGEESLLAWDQAAVVPAGWLIDTRQIIQNWQTFAEMIKASYPAKTILVVTSNGITRFAPYLTGDFSAFKENFALKIATGATASLTALAEHWHVDFWNIKPDLSLSMRNGS